MATSTSKNNTSKNEHIDSPKFLNIAIRHWWLFILSFALCFGVLYLYLRKTPPTYIVSSTVLIDDSSLASFTGVSGNKSSSMLKSMIGGGDVNVNNEIEIFASESLCAKAIHDLGINCRYYEKTGFMKKQDHYGTSPIIVDAPKELFDTLSIILPFKIKVHADGKADITVKKGLFSNYADIEGAELPATVKTPYGLFVVKPTKYFTPKHEYSITASVAGYIPAALELQEDMTVNLKAKKTDMVYLDIMDSNTQRGRDFLTTLIRLYNERCLKESDTQGMTTARFIDERLSLIYKNLMGSEAEIEAYKKAHNLIDPVTQAKTTIIKGETSESAIVALETQYRITSMIKGFVTDPANKHSLIPFESDSLSSKMVRAYNALITQRQHLETSAKADNPALVQLDQQLNAMRENMLGSVNNALGAMRIKIEKAKDVQGESKGNMSQFATTERDTRNLYRNQAIQNELYLFLLQKREENALKMAAAQPKGKTVDAAYADHEPVKPKKVVVFAIAFLFALALPTCWIYIKILLDNKVRTKNGLKALSAIPVLGSISHSKHFNYIEADEGTTSEQFRLLRDNLQFMLPNQTSNVMAVTSNNAEEGKTYIATNLALSFAILGKRVALVDFNIRTPKIAEIFDIPASSALTTFISQSEMDLADIVYTSDSLSNLDIYPAGTIPPNPSELLQNERTVQLFKQLRDQYDVVIADTVGIGSVSDTLSVAKNADTTVVVVRANTTKNSELNNINQLTADGKLKNVGLVLNDETCS